MRAATWTRTPRASHRHNAELTVVWIRCEEGVRHAKRCHDLTTPRPVGDLRRNIRCDHVVYSCLQSSHGFRTLSRRDDANVLDEGACTAPRTHSARDTSRHDPTNTRNLDAAGAPSSKW